MSQPLTIRFATDLEGAKRGMASLAASVASNALTIGTALKNANDNVTRFQAGVERARSLVALLPGAVALGVAAFAGFEIAKSAVEQANEQLDKFIKLGKDAEQAGVGVEFFQRFTDQAKALKVEVGELEAALKRAAGAVTPKFEDAGPVRKRLGELFQTGYLGDFESAGFKQFDKATDNEGRIRATLVAMRELQEIGQNLAAIDVGEKLFGSAFADKIRAGKVDLEAMVDALDRKRDDLVSQEEVQRAEELRDRIATAKEEIDRFLHVSVALEASGEALIRIWARILEGVAVAASAADRFVANVAKGAGIVQGIIARQAAATQETSHIDGVDTLGFSPALAKARDDRNNALTARGAGIDVGGLDEGRRAGAIADFRAKRAREEAELNAPPLPPHRPQSLAGDQSPRASGGRSSSGGAGSQSLDQIERFINQLEKSKATIEAEVGAFGKSNVEKEKAIDLARLNAAAKEAERAPTDAETAAVLRNAEAVALAKDRLRELEQQQRLNAEAFRFFGSAASDALGDLIFNGAKASDVMKGLVSSLGRQSLTALLTGSGPLAGLFNTAPSANATGAASVGGLFGMLFSGFAGKFADGGTIPAGRWGLVGERGPELISVGSTAHTITPITAGGGGVMVQGDTISIDARGAAPGTEGRFMAALEARDRRNARNIRGTLLDAQRRQVR